MVRLRLSRCLAPGLMLLAASGAAAAAGPASSRKAQVHFGVDMAKRGLWNEALFRFENARKLEPNDPSVLNNLAVCYEASGRFEEALATYREALKIAPGNNAVKQNYSRFAEFYQGYRPRKKEGEVTAPAPVVSVAPAPAEPAPAEPPPPVPPPTKPPLFGEQR